jgi:Fe-S oxidoreductase
LQRRHSGIRIGKQEELVAGIARLTGAQRASANNVKILTSCPACQQGLSRYAEDTGLQTYYIVVELANETLGKDWQKRFISRTQSGGVERALL